MPVKLDDTGERMVPEFHKGKNIYGAHVARYEAGLSVIKNKVVLDVACGVGYGTKLMSKLAEKVFGVDIDEKTIAYARENYNAANIHYKVGSATKIPLEDQSVDVVVSYETIEHVDDYYRFLEEVKRVLKPNGQLLLSTPNENEYTHNNEFHVHEFRYESLKKLLHKYFRYQKEYFQSHWIYSSILPSGLQSSEWSSMIRTINTVPVSPKNSIFFYVLCSNKPIKNDIEPIGAIGEHYRLRDLHAANKKTQQIKQTLDKSRAKLNEVSDQNRLLQRELHAITNSKSWRASLIIRKFALIAKKPQGLFRHRDDNKQ